VIVKEGFHKPNHPIQNPLLLFTILNKWQYNITDLKGKLQEGIGYIHLSEENEHDRGTI
jgi:hypothetical protein